MNSAAPDTEIGQGRIKLLETEFLRSVSPPSAQCLFVKWLHVCCRAVCQLMVTQRCTRRECLNSRQPIVKLTYSMYYGIPYVLCLSLCWWSCTGNLRTVKCLANAPFMRIRPIGQHQFLSAMLEFWRRTILSAQLTEFYPLVIIASIRITAVPYRYRRSPTLVVPNQGSIEKANIKECIEDRDRCKRLHPYCTLATWNS